MDRRHAPAGDVRKPGQPATMDPTAPCAESLCNALEHAGHFIYRYDFRADRFTHLGGRLQDVLGCTPDDYQQRTWQQLEEDIHPAHRSRYRETLQFAQPATGDRHACVQQEYRRRGADGDYRWYEEWCTLYFDEQGTLCFAVGALRDITKQQRTARDLEHHIRLLESLLDTIPSPVFYKDVDGRYLGCNEAFARRVLGRSKETIIGKTMRELSDVIPPAFAEIYEAQDEFLLDDPGVQAYESPVRYATGVRRDIVFHKATFEDVHGDVAGIVGVMVDVTELKEAETEIRRLREQINAILADEPAGLPVQPPPAQVSDWRPGSGRA